jgi:hypothetical protein
VAAVSSRMPLLDRVWGLGLGRRAVALMPALALASLAGFPLTVGAVGRWQLYAALLRTGNGLLFGLVVADTLLAAALWHVVRFLPQQVREQRCPLRPSLTLVLLFGLNATAFPDVSLWGLGLLYVVPWLLGAWLARVSAQLAAVPAVLGQIVGLDWLYRAGTGLFERLGNAVYWLGQVGEGEGWWGWVLIVLGLGAMFLSGR